MLVSLGIEMHVLSKLRLRLGMQAGRGKKGKGKGNREVVVGAGGSWD
jgi:hypothetical protein